MTGMVPEPERKKENEHIDEPLQVEIDQAVDVYSTDSSDDEMGNEDDGAGVVNGYIPLPQFQSDDDADDENTTDHSSESDGEAKGTNEPSKERDREIHVDQDQVMHAMKGISISGSCIPAWAKELSDNEWNNIIKRTISGEKVLPKPNSSS